MGSIFARSLTSEKQPAAGMPVGSVLARVNSTPSRIRTPNSRPALRFCILSCIVGCGYVSACSSGYRDSQDNLAAPIPRAVQHSAAGGSGDDFGEAIALDPNGRLVVAGGSLRPSGDLDLAVWRYTTDGTLDPTFSGGGILTHHGAAGGFADDFGTSVAVDSQNRIIVVGGSDNGMNFDLAVWRIDDSGVLDSGFGIGGVALHDGAAGGFANDIGRAVEIDPTDQILVAGESVSAGGDPDMACWRFDASGILDLGFAGAGFLVRNGTAGGNGIDRGTGVGIDSMNRVLICGSSSNASGDPEMTLWCFLPNGSEDPSFGVTGSVVHDPYAAGGAGAFALAFSSSGEIVVTGSSTKVQGNSDMVIWRFGANGSIDPGFNSKGWIAHDSAAGGTGNDVGMDVSVDGSGRIVVAGFSLRSGNEFDMAVWAYDGDLRWGVHHGAAGGQGTDVGLGLVAGSDSYFIAGYSQRSAGDFDSVLWEWD